MEVLKWQKRKPRKRQQKKQRRIKERRKNKHLRILCCHIAIGAFALMAFYMPRWLHAKFHRFDNYRIF